MSCCKTLQCNAERKINLVSCSKSNHSVGSKKGLPKDDCVDTFSGKLLCVLCSSGAPNYEM
jgi:hypothetical protein